MPVAGTTVPLPQLEMQLESMAILAENDSAEQQVTSAKLSETTCPGKSNEHTEQCKDTMSNLGMQRARQ